MKLLVTDPSHGMSHSLQQVVASRQDVTLQLVEDLAEALGHLDAHSVDAVVIPPLTAPEHLSLTVIEQHVVLVETLLASCRRFGITLLWCVGCQLFEEDHEHLLTEQEQPKPLSAGLHKLVALEASIREWPHHIVLRVSELFGSEGEGMWLPGVLSRWLKGESVRVNDHLFSAPLPVDALTRALLGILLQLDNGADAWGVFHLAGREPVSQYEFAGIALSYLQKMQIAVAESAVPALQVEGATATIRRILSCQKVLLAYGIHQPEWRDALYCHVKNWLQRYYGHGVAEQN